jgi:hypothetical protein
MIRTMDQSQKSATERCHKNTHANRPEKKIKRYNDNHPSASFPIRILIIRLFRRRRGENLWSSVRSVAFGALAFGQRFSAGGADDVKAAGSAFFARGEVVAVDGLIAGPVADIGWDVDGGEEEPQSSLPSSSSGFTSLFDVLPSPFGLSCVCTDGLSSSSSSMSQLNCSLLSSHAPGKQSHSMRIEPRWRGITYLPRGVCASPHLLRSDVRGRNSGPKMSQPAQTRI